MNENWRYLRWLLGALFVLNALALWLPKQIFASEWYLAHSDNHYDLMVDFHLHHRGENNDVVILGDSAAMMGVNPALVGEKIVSLSLYGYSGFGSWQLLVDDYLAHNAAPKQVVLYLVPMSLAVNLKADRDQLHYEAVHLAYRLQDFPTVAARILRHPEGLSAAYLGIWHAIDHSFGHLDLAGHRARVIEYAQRSHGGSRMPLIYDGWQKPTLAEGCRFDEKVELPLDGLIGLKRHLEARGIRTRVYVAPTPACDADPYRGLQVIADNPIEKRPSSDFYDRSHMTEAAAADNSRRFAEWLR